MTTILRHNKRKQGEPRERGASIVEAAFVTPLFVFLILAIMEFGPLFFQWGSVRDSVSEGVRLSSIVGSREGGDYDTIQAMRPTLKNLGKNFEFVVIYKAATLRGSPPQECLDEANKPANITSTAITPVGVFKGGTNNTNPPPAMPTAYTPIDYPWGKTPLPAGALSNRDLIACNIYYPRMFTAPRTKWTFNQSDALAGTYSLDYNWPTNNRVDYMSGPQDYAGVYVQSRYTSTTGLLKDRTLKRSGVMRIEPTRATK